jgi:hypothetical protein
MLILLLLLSSPSVVCNWQAHSLVVFYRELFQRTTNHHCRHRRLVEEFVIVRQHSTKERHRLYKQIHIEQYKSKVKHNQTTIVSIDIEHVYLRVHHHCCRRCQLNRTDEIQLFVHY